MEMLVEMVCKQDEIVMEITIMKIMLGMIWEYTYDGMGIIMENLST
jgi:hypothetical protein